MTLRGRLALTLGAAVIPLAVVLALWQQWRRHEADVQLVRERVIARMEAGGREVCEEAPERFRGRGRGPSSALAPRRGPGPRGARRAALMAEREAQRAIGPLMPFAADGSGAEQPPPAELLREVLDGADVASRVVRRGPEGGGQDEYEVLVAMPWTDGPCALVLARAPVHRDAAIASALTGVGVGFAAVFVAWLAAAPLVGRLRRLEEAASRGPGKSAVAIVGGADEVTAVARALDADRARIEAQVHELEQRDAALVAYIANTTHDVMLPLTVLQGHLVAAREQLGAARAQSAEASAMGAATPGGGPRGAVPGVDEALRLAVEESDYLGSLLRNLNARARLDAAGEQRVREPVDLGALVERVIARNRMVARDRRVSLEYAVPDEPVHALGDVTLLERALSNVVHNAVRYNDADGHVAVVLASRAGRFTLRVTDDGPGLDAEDLPRITERGYRGNVARTRHPHGMGLGLHITSDVVAQHGFELRMQRPADAERGLEVLIEGPLELPAGPASSASREPTPAAP